MCETIALTPFRFALRSVVLVASMALVAVALGGCGRRGPLELPPDVTARARQVEIQEPSGGGKNGKPKAPIPGTIGNRPPDQHPFFLDPLL